MKIKLCKDAEKDPEMFDFLEKYVGERFPQCDMKIYLNGFALPFSYEGTAWSVRRDIFTDIHTFILQCDGRKLRRKKRTEFILKWGG